MEGQCAEEGTCCERSDDTTLDRKEERVGNRVVRRIMRKGERDDNQKEESEGMMEVYLNVINYY
jgi:uncharacterized protein (UPF0335 family)